MDQGRIIARHCPADNLPCLPALGSGVGLANAGRGGLAAATKNRQVRHFPVGEGVGGGPQAAITCGGASHILWDLVDRLFISIWCRAA